jgi:hypothetical protein
LSLQSVARVLAADMMNATQAIAIERMVVFISKTTLIWAVDILLSTHYIVIIPIILKTNDLQQTKPMKNPKSRTPAFARSEAQSA